MAKTIIQTIGPLYGESVNGTVFGRPNGSIYVPSQNTIVISLDDSQRYIKSMGENTIVYSTCNSSGAVITGGGVKAVAESQDIQNYIQYQVSADADFGTIAGSRSMSAGSFNVKLNYIASGVGLDPIENETTYYLRAVLMSANGEPVATSEAIEVTGVSE